MWRPSLLLAAPRQLDLNVHRVAKQLVKCEGGCLDLADPNVSKRRTRKINIKPA